MTHKVIAVVNGNCPHCNNFRTAHVQLDAETKLKMLVCDVNATDLTCVEAMNGVNVNAFPTFKCVSKKTIIEGFGDIATVVQFVNECP
jgi:hypothetical protein